MSKGAVSQVIQRAIGDAAFRRQLQGDPKKALAGFDLTTDERSAITSGDPGRLTALGVDQRMSKAFNLSGISAASKSAVSPDLTGAGASAFIDEGTGSRTTSAIETGGASANAANLRRIEGDLNVSAAREAEDVSGDFNAFDPGIVSNTASAVREEGALNVGAARLPIDVSGDFNALDPGIVSNTTSAVRDAAQSVNAMNLRRIEGDLNVGAATALEPVDASGDFNQLDPGMISGDTAARATDIAKDAGAYSLRPNELTE